MFKLQSPFTFIIKGVKGKVHSNKPNFPILEKFFSKQGGNNELASQSSIDALLQKAGIKEVRLEGHWSVQTDSVEELKELLSFVKSEQETFPQRYAQVLDTLFGKVKEGILFVQEIEKENRAQYRAEQHAAEIRMAEAMAAAEAHAAEAKVKSDAKWNGIWDEAKQKASKE